MFTETSVNVDSDAFSDQTIARTTNFKDYALSFGGGGGVLLELVSWTDGRLNLDLGARYVFGGEADYLVPEFLSPSDEVADLEVNRSRTDIVTIHFGVMFEF